MLTPAPSSATPLNAHPDKTKAIIATVFSLGGLSVLIANALFHWRPLRPVALWIIIAVLIESLLLALGWNLNGKWYGALIDSRNRVSLSRLQVTLWMVIALSAYLTLAILRSAPGALGQPTSEEVSACRERQVAQIAGQSDVAAWRAANPQEAANADAQAVELCTPQPLQITFPAELLLALGISTASFAGSNLVQSIKRNKRNLNLLIDIQRKMEGAQAAFKKGQEALAELSAQVGLYTRAQAEAQQQIDAATSEEEKQNAQVELSNASLRFQAATAKLPQAQSDYENAKKTLEDLQSKWEVTNKEKEGLLKVNESSAQATLSDMFQGDEIGNYNLIDLGKIQMFFFTVVIILAYAVALSGLMQSSGIYDPFGVSLPQFSTSLNALLGLSHAGYLSVKSIDQTKTD